MEEQELREILEPCLINNDIYIIDKILEYLKTASDVTLKGRPELRTCDACAKAKTHKAHTPSSTTKISKETQGQVHCKGFQSNLWC